MTKENFGYQFKHLLTLSDNHDLSYGVEFIPKNRFKNDEILSITPTGKYMGFYDEIMLSNSEFYAMRGMTYRDSIDGWRYDSKPLLAYFNDRWKIVDNLFVEYGLTYEQVNLTNSIDNEGFKHRKIHPRLGISWQLKNSHNKDCLSKKTLSWCYPVLCTTYNSRTHV